MFKNFDIKDSNSLKFPEPKQHEEDLKFGVKLLKIVITKSSELHNEIKGKTPNWDPERIAFIDKVILRTAIAELLYFKDIPTKVTLNEYLEIAKDYSTPNSNTFVDNVYIVKTNTTNAALGEIVCDVHTNSASSISGINTVGFHSTGQAGMTTSLGQLNWGILKGANLTRSTNPISIGVTGLTVDSGLSTFPTITRKNFVSTSVRGLRSTGAIRVFGL